MREGVPGSAHSCCKALRHKAPHPNDPGVIKLETHLAIGLVSLKTDEDEEVIKINPHGRKNGWANWPLDFDPIWVSECKFYLPQDPTFEKV
jgi:hypothetical protein